jgi:hypothetical protein
MLDVSHHVIDALCGGTTATQWCGGTTALQYAIVADNNKLVEALIAVGASTKAPSSGAPPVVLCAYFGNAGCLRLLIDGGGCVNDAGACCRTPLIALVVGNLGDAVERMAVLLSRSELEFDTKYEGKTAQQWAVLKGRHTLAAMIADEIRKRARWASVSRAAFLLCLKSAHV